MALGAVDFVSIIITPLIAIGGVIYAISSNNKNRQNQNDDEQWKAINSLKEILTKEYMTAEATKEFFRLSQESSQLRLKHIEEQVESTVKALEDLKNTSDEIRQLLAAQAERELIKSRQTPP